MRWRSCHSPPPLSDGENSKSVSRSGWPSGKRPPPARKTRPPAVEAGIGWLVRSGSGVTALHRLVSPSKTSAVSTVSPMAEMPPKQPTVCPGPRAMPSSDVCCVLGAARPQMPPSGSVTAPGLWQKSSNARPPYAERAASAQRSEQTRSCTAALSSGSSERRCSGVPPPIASSHSSIGGEGRRGAALAGCRSSGSSSTARAIVLGSVRGGVGWGGCDGIGTVGGARGGRGPRTIDRLCCSVIGCSECTPQRPPPFPPSPPATRARETPARRRGAAVGDRTRTNKVRKKKKEIAIMHPQRSATEIGGIVELPSEEEAQWNPPEAACRLRGSGKALRILCEGLPKATLPD